MHHYFECTAGSMTKKQAAAALVGLGRLASNAAAFAAAKTAIAEFKAAVDKIYPTPLPLCIYKYPSSNIKQKRVFCCYTAKNISRIAMRAS